MSNFKVKINNFLPQVHTGVAHLKGQEPWRAGSYGSHTPWVGLECQLPRPLAPANAQLSARGRKGGGARPAQIQGTIATLKTPHRRNARDTPRSPLSGGGGPRRDARPASARPARGTKFRKREKVFREGAAAVAPLPERRAPPAQAQAAPGSRPGPTLPRAEAAQSLPAPSPGPRPAETLGPPGAPRAPRGEAQRFTCGERGERRTTPEAPSRRPPLCLPPVRLPGGNGPPCAPAPGPPRAAPARPSRHLPPRALPSASRGLHTARPGLRRRALSGKSLPPGW